MIQDVRTNGGMDSGGKRNFQLGSHSIGAGYKNRIAPALAIELEKRTKAANGSQDATAKCFSRHRGDPTFDAVSYRDVHSSIGIAHKKNLLSESGGKNLENVKQTLPAHFARVDDGVEVRRKTFADVSRLPDILGSVDGHVNHKGRADDIFAWHESPVAAVVRVFPIVAHHKVIAGRNLVRTPVFEGVGRVRAVRLG